jgi:hypothetical protein
MSFQHLRPLRTLMVSFQHLKNLPKEFNSYGWQVTIWNGIKHPKMFVCNILLPCTPNLIDQYNEQGTLYTNTKTVCFGLSPIFRDTIKYVRRSSQSSRSVTVRQGM